tara:strand:+ start:32485 stop:33495 length:1011 start_codon:yes stop_codon:yes gene_type:complete
MSELEKLYSINKTASLSLSYSRVSDFDRNGPKALNKKRDSAIAGEGVKIGSLVDDLLLNSHNFKKLYYLYDGSKPTATLGKLCDIIFENYKRTPSKNTILKIAKKNNFWSKWSKDKVMEAIDVPDFWGWLKASYASKKKTLVTTPDIELANELVEILKTHQFSSPIINSKCEHFNQFKFNINYKGFLMRGIMDKILVDHETKTVRFIDLKTGKGPIAEFESSFIKWRYYLQSAVYTKAFKKFCEMQGLEGYKLLPFQFLYISRTEKIPLVFTVTRKWHKASLNGFKTAAGYRYRGLGELLDEITWHVDNQIFDTTRKITESKGALYLDDSFIYLDK